MAGVFAELDIESMMVTGGALREGVLYDLVGRFHHHDQRDASVNHFMSRYHVDAKQTVRVEALALHLLEQATTQSSNELDLSLHLLSWAARLHEVGISIAHAGYHKHSAYILAHADMPGFSKHDQARLSLLVRAHRGSLVKLTREQALEDVTWGLLNSHEFLLRR